VTSVAKERLKSPRARLFVALDLPEDVRDGLAAWQRDQVTAKELRPARPETLHMTLAFLGYLPEKQIDDIAEAATAGLASAAPEARLLPNPVGVPRGRSRPGLFAIEADSPGAIELQAEVESKLVAAGFYEPEKRDFWPHLTVARVRQERRAAGSGGKRRRGRPMRVETPPGPLPDALLQPFFCVRVALYRSLLRPSGAEYVSMATVELPLPAAERQVEDGKAPDPA
jgi:RNA 2',3'-cyclic 3'-phosphodiesterase